MSVILWVLQPQSRKPLAKDVNVEVLCCSAPYFGREIRDEKRDFFHALKATAFPIRCGNMKMSLFAGADAALVSL